jgi:hypothetical protein
MLFSLGKLNKKPIDYLKCAQHIDQQAKWTHHSTMCNTLC